MLRLLRQHAWKSWHLDAVKDISNLNNICDEGYFGLDNIVYETKHKSCALAQILFAAKIDLKQKVIFRGLYINRSSEDLVISIFGEKKLGSKYSKRKVIDV